MSQLISDHLSVKRVYDESAQYFPTPIQLFQYLDKYSRFDWDKGRRETWMETVWRATDYLRELSQYRLSENDYVKIRTSILNMRAMPSMRLLAMAGPAARRQNICIYNCSYIPVDSVDAFVEALIISMSGCGVGFSVERANVDKLPRVGIYTGSYQRDIEVIDDTTEGWAHALRMGISYWLEGNDITFDYGQIRPAGAVLKTKGGRASGPAPLQLALEKIRNIIMARQGGRLRPIDAHDIMCLIGNAAVSGGMRRTAMISIFDADDQEMLHCKDGDFYIKHPERWNANNSAVVDFDTMTQQEFMYRFSDMVRSERGEPGFFSRKNAQEMVPERRNSEVEFGTNPCAEIILRPMQFCNLSIAVARPDDTFESLRDKVEVATIIGTIQSMATHFPGLRPQWEENGRNERLMGVDITGQMDAPIVRDARVMRILREHARLTNLEYARRLGINESAAITTVKPSGNSSQLLNCSSGLHARWARYYIRRVRVSAYGPLYKCLLVNGVPMRPENGQVEGSADTYVVSFPMKSDPKAVVKSDLTAIDQCEHWLMNSRNWTEHNPSVTITYRPDEVLDLANWVWDHRQEIIGMSFLPSFDAKYDQLPYEEIDEKTYNAMIAEFPEIDFSYIASFESTDETNAAQELACFAGQCDL